MANSTSSQLSLIGVIYVMRRFRRAMEYVVAHAIFKSAIFMLVGVSIHLIENQGRVMFRSLWSLRFSWLLMVLVMCGLPYYAVAGVKDQFIVNSGCDLLFCLAVLVLSTLLYSLKLLCYDSSHDVYSRVVSRRQINPLLRWTTVKVVFIFWCPGVIGQRGLDLFL